MSSTLGSGEPLAGCQDGRSVAVFLGLLVALSYGAGDFLGGLSSRRLDAPGVVQVSQFVGLLALAVAVAALPDQRFLGDDAVRGAVAGTVGLVGVVLLYRGLAIGVMSVVAPITAVGAAVLPFGWGLLQGERPGVPSLVGVALALVAVALVSGGGRTDDDPDVADVPLVEIGLAVVAGAAFGVVFILLADTDADSGLWPVLLARVASVSVVTIGLLAVRHRAPRLPPAAVRLHVAGAGILDASANALFLLAAREGLLSLVAVVSSLYPAVTVVLARLLLAERVSRGQQLGLVAALTGVVLIATA